MISDAKESYYTILGVEEDASQEEIRCAYRTLARAYHPDSSTRYQGKDADQSLFIRVHEAYQTLIHPHKRRRYDELLVASHQESRSVRNPSSSSDDPQSAHTNASVCNQTHKTFRDAIYEYIHERQRDKTVGTFQWQSAEWHNRAHESGSANPLLDVRANLAISYEDAIHGALHTITVHYLQPDNLEIDRAKFLIRLQPLTRAGEVLRLKGCGLLERNLSRRGDLYLHIEYLGHRLYQCHGDDLVTKCHLARERHRKQSFISLLTPDGRIQLPCPLSPQSTSPHIFSEKGLPKIHGGRGRFIVCWK